MHAQTRCRSVDAREFTAGQKKLWKIRTGPPGRAAVAGRGPQGLRASGPLGRRGPWAAGLLLAKPVWQALKGRSPNSPSPSPSPINDCHAGYAAALIITVKCTCLQYGARQTMGFWDENGDTLDFLAMPFHTTYRIVCCLANTLQQMLTETKRLVGFQTATLT